MICHRMWIKAILIPPLLSCVTWTHHLQKTTKGPFIVTTTGQFIVHCSCLVVRYRSYWWSAVCTSTAVVQCSTPMILRKNYSFAVTSRSVHLTEYSSQTIRSSGGKPYSTAFSCEIVLCGIWTFWSYRYTYCLQYLKYFVGIMSLTVSVVPKEIL